jgi:hypothetical protein
MQQRNYTGSLGASDPLEAIEGHAQLCALCIGNHVGNRCRTFKGL